VRAVCDNRAAGRHLPHHGRGRQARRSRCRGRVPEHGCYGRTATLVAERLGRRFSQTGARRSPGCGGTCCLPRCPP
jgi:hypothetical protein